MVYKVVTSKRFDRQYAKLSLADKDLVDDVIGKIASGKKLEAKYRDHKLRGKLLGLRDCHVKPDLVLIYGLDNDMLLLNAVDLGNHSNLFK